MRSSPCHRAALALLAAVAIAPRAAADTAPPATPLTAPPAPPPYAVGPAPWSPPFTAPVYPAYASPPPPPPEAPRFDPRVADAHADRVIVEPTAYTHPEGTLYFTSYDLVGLQAGWAFSDAAQVTVTGMPPLETERIVPLDFTVKAAVFRAPRVRAAVLGSATGLLGAEQGPIFVGRAGGVVQACFDDACDASASIGSNLLLAGPALLSVEGAGAVIPFSRLFAVLVEADALVPLGKAGGDYNGVAAGAGVRFRGRTWAVDLAGLRPFDQRDVPIVPLLSATYRVLP